MMKMILIHQDYHRPRTDLNNIQAQKLQHMKEIVDNVRHVS